MLSSIKLLGTRTGGGSNCKTIAAAVRSGHSILKALSDWRGLGGLGWASDITMFLRASLLGFDDEIERKWFFVLLVG